MVGSELSSTDRSKEAVGMMVLHEALRNICLNSDWTYSVFWTIRPRPRRSRSGNGCKIGDDNGSLMLMWEDGFCRGRVSECSKEMDNEDTVRKAFSKMSIQLYNYGEGLMGKVASDKCHKWVLKETSECEPNISNYWQSSFDALPSEWTEQFNSGIQTIAVIQAGHGLLQLGSCEIIPEDLHFVLRMRHTFESLGFQPGFYLSQLFSSNRDLSSFSSSSSLNVTKHPSVCRPPPIFNWSQRSIPCATNFQNNANIAFPPKDGIQLCHLPHSNETLIEDMVAEHDSDIKWPSGLSFFTALTGRSEDAKLLLGEEGLSKQSIEHNPFVSTSKMLMNFSSDPNLSRAISESSNTEMRNPNEYLSLESHHSNDKPRENRFKRSFTSPARMASSSSSSSMDHHNQQQPVSYRSSEARIYPDIMENFLN